MGRPPKGKSGERITDIYPRLDIFMRPAAKRTLMALRRRTGKSAGDLVSDAVEFYSKAVLKQEEKS
jgi:hypothetical protein